MAPPASPVERSPEGLPEHEGVDLLQPDDPGDVDVLVDAATDRVRGADPELMGVVGASGDDLDALAALVAGRLELILAPDAGDWRELARSEGGTWPESLAEMPEPARARYEGWADWWRTAEFAVAATALRHLRLDDLDSYIEQFGAITAKNPLSAQYAIDDRARVVEAVIPVRVADRAGGQALVEAHLGIAYWWSTAQQRWRPAMVTVYTDGEVVVPPPM
ncbi:MAG: hypothetical protein ACF8QF_12915 [Phycisphaerales bacterium]